MGDPLPPDPYLALGVTKDASAAVIKATYRKLILKTHPDKIQDESLRQAASDEFHKIQTAFEIIGDDERRQRYDAQCRLSALRREMMGKDGPGRGAQKQNYRASTDPAREDDYFSRAQERSAGMATPVYEERRPSYNQDDYFSTRSVPRKDAEYERAPKRSSYKEDREKPRASTKESERASRKEKTRRAEKDVRKDRDRKFASYVTVEEGSSSESDQFERMQRRYREEDDLRRARETYYDTARSQKEQVGNGYFPDERVQKMFAQGIDAKEYIEQMRRPQAEPERRPSPVRMPSSKDKVEYIKRTEGRPPVMIRRGSGRPKTAGRDEIPRKSSARETREKGRRPSAEFVDEEPQQATRPPPLNQSKSSPADIRPPFMRQRSHSMQGDHAEPPIPQVRRSDTMPTAPSPRSSRRDPSYPTPSPTPDPQPRKYRYGQEYADDQEYATPDGYRTEVREPETRPKLTRSPSPIGKGRERSRMSYTKDAAPRPPSMPRTTSTQYVYGRNEDGEPRSRPSTLR